MRNQEKEQKLDSRRNFLKKSAMMGVGVAAGTALTACAPNQAAAGKTAMKWDKEVDVLVIGSGTVAIAAVSAKDAGAEKVLVIEKGPAFGGTTAISGGGMWIPVNYLEKEEGIEDNRDDAFKYMKAVSDNQSTDELINAYLDNAPKLLEWMRDKFGVKYAIGGTQYNDYYQLPGYRARGRSLFYTQDGKIVNGPGAWKIIHDILDKLGVEIMLKTAGKKLITNEKGEVIGAVAVTEDGKEINISAKKGVILGTGGFDFNNEMRNAYIRGPIFASNSVPTNTGDGHLMGMAIGADLRNMNSCWGVPHFPTDADKLKGEADWQVYRGKPGAIVVNKHGERIGNEASAYHVFNRAFWVWDTGTFEWRNTPSFFICDSTFLEHYPLPGTNYKVGEVPDWFKKADTLEDLAKQLGIEVEALTATVEAFNANAKEGKDPVWHRGEYDFDMGTAADPSRTDLKNTCLAPVEKGPFYGASYGPGTCGTNGGLRINANAQVLDVWGNPIPHLYAVGNTSGSVMGAAYPGGGSTVGAGSVMGMVAGKHAASQTTEA